MSNQSIISPASLIGFLTLSIFIGTVVASDEQRISSLSALDRQYLDVQRQSIDDLARRHLGRQLNHTTDNNLSILQALLDQKLVRPEQKQLLQSMGVVLGERLSIDLGMQWVVIEDRYGRSRALRLGATDNFLFPITMISRRAEVGAQVSTRAIYHKAYDLMQPFIQKGPFQY